MAPDKQSPNPPIKIPLGFDQLASNIFKVDVKKLPDSARPGASKKKRPAKKRPGKK